MRIYAPLVRHAGWTTNQATFYGAMQWWDYSPRGVMEAVWGAAERHVWPRGVWFIGVTEMQLVFPVRGEALEYEYELEN